ncbi:MAG: NrtA/SsuA/CpmA family ABC transporter substrate-binding protein [Acidobacteriota bacterium]
MIRKAIFPLGILLAAAAAGIACGRADQAGQQPEDAGKLVLGAETSLLPATVWVAEAKGYFQEAGLEVEIRDFDSGRNALEAMLGDPGIDMATVAQTPVIFNSFSNRNFRIIASMAYSVDDTKVLALKHRGISTARDLIGKKVGVTLRSTGHYFLEGFLLHYGYSVNDVTLVDLDAAQLPKALAGGELDAITSWEPHIDAAQRIIESQDQALLLSPTPFRKLFFFTVRSERLAVLREPLKRFLQALIRAERFIGDDPQEAQRIVSRRLGLDSGLVSRLWPVFHFEISLEQSILVSLEDEAHWAVRKGYSSGEGVPNYLDLIDWRILEGVDSGKVTLIH